MDINPNHLLTALQRQRDYHANDSAQGWAENMALKEQLKAKDAQIADLEAKLAEFEKSAGQSQ